MLYTTILTIDFSTPHAISAISHLTLAIVSIVNFIFIYCIFRKQKKKDLEDFNKSEKLRRENLKLTWFRELIILPQWDNVNNYYENVLIIASKLKVQNLLYGEKMKILNELKDETSELRKSFVDILMVVDLRLHSLVLASLDKMQDGITEVAYDEGINLNHEPKFKSKVENLITYSKNDIISLVFSFDGESVNSSSNINT